MSRVPFWRRYTELPVAELQRSNPVRFGLVVLALLAVLVYFGFAKHIPFTHGFRLKAVFPSAMNISAKSPVRVAGVSVGVVSSVQRHGSTGLVTMEISNAGLPIHRDATLKIRPRIFLEGNWFVELQPGTPSAPTLSSGDTIPITQTSDPVQLDQVLDALNTDTRANLQTFLIEYGKTLKQKPTPEQDAAQNEAVRGLNAAQALKAAYHDAPQALKGNAIVSQALGGVEQHDLSKLLAGTGRLTAALNVHEQQLGELIGNFNTFLGALALQSGSLRSAVAQLPGALQNAGRAFRGLDAASPSIRNFSNELVPGVQQLKPTIAAALPWIEEVQASLGPAELGGLAKGLRSAAPALSGLIVPQNALLKQSDLLAKCFTNVIFPSGNAKLQDGAGTSGVENYREFWYAMAGWAGAGQNFDGNGATTRFMVSTGSHLLESAPVTTAGAGPKTGEARHRLLAHTSQAPQGTRPAFPASEPPYKPLVPCYTQKVQDFNGPLSQGPADASGG